MERCLKRIAAIDQLQLHSISSGIVLTNPANINTANQHDPSKKWLKY